MALPEGAKDVSGESADSQHLSSPESADTIDQDRGESDTPPPPPQFAPGAPTDGRSKFDFESRYDKTAWPQIVFEALYLLLIFTSSAGILFMFGPRSSSPWPGLLSQGEWLIARPYFLAFVGGALGGTLFALKWLYHSVAKGLWNRDRVLWRIFTPILAAGAATTMVILSSSGVIPLFGPELAKSPTGALGIAFLTGFFSDRAFSLFENTIQSLFGPPQGHSSHDGSRRQDG